MKKISTILLFIIIFFSSFLIIRADELEDIGKQLDDFKRALEMSQRATKPLEADVAKLNKQLEGIKARVALLEKEIIRKQKEVKEGEEILIHQKTLLEERTKTYYKNINKNSVSLIQLLIAENISTSLQNFFYQKHLMDEDKKTIIKIVVYIKDLEDKKKNLESEKAGLAKLKIEVDRQSQFLAGEINKAKKYQSELQQKIAELTAKQQQILAQKLASLNLPSSLGAGPLYCTDDRKIDPGFSPGFAFFTFGIPHRVGMNQYGALGRAKAGHDFRRILGDYFNNTRLECRSSPNKNIKVQGYGEIPMEEYLKGIYEMPGDWPIEALKAQVVAARSYALAYTHWGEGEICTTQSCQVYKGGNKGENWERAVFQTGQEACSDGQGLTLISNDTNDVVTAWYASTAGGYTFRSADVGWNDKPWTKRMRDFEGDVGSIQELMDKAFDKDSPCFYAAQGWRGEYGKSAWLKTEEAADIVNVLLLAKRDSGVQNHLSQIDKPNPDNVETWSPEKVKQELKNRGGVPYNTLSNISVDWDRGVGKSTSVNVSGDAGNNSFDANEFKNFFNLRAPANIQIVGPLYNVEKR